MEINMYDLNVVCKEANEYTYGVGMIGYETLELERKYDKDWGLHGYSFGWVYSGLRSIDLIPKQVEDFKKFLEKHKDKTIIIIHENDPREAWNGIDDELLVKYEPEKDDTYKKCIYRITNMDSGAFIESSVHALLRVGERQLSKDDIKEFISKLDGLPDIDNYLSGNIAILDPDNFLNDIRKFIKKNKKKKLVVTKYEI
jgi:hypothetical protein